LAHDPNNQAAFDELADILRARTADEAQADNPLTADDPVHSPAPLDSGDLAVWSLAEEMAGSPRAWYPLLELGRLSVMSDIDGALRRLSTAAQRDPDGNALAAAIETLRWAGRPSDALSLGTGHWRVREQTPKVAAQMVFAALEAGRPMDAKQHLAALDLHPKSATLDALRDELLQAVRAFTSQDGAPRTLS
jgi:hypothetical protein